MKGSDVILVPLFQADVERKYRPASESLIRLSFLGVIPRQLVRGKLGNISDERHKRLLRRLIDYLINTD